MRAKGFSIGLLIGILLLGVSVAFGQDAADVITTANAAKLKQIMKIEDKDKELNELGILFSPDGKLLAFQEDTDLHFIDVVTQKESTTIPLDSSSKLWLAFTPDGKSLSGVTEFFSKVFSWDLATGEALPSVSVKDDTSDAYWVVISSDSKFAAVGLEKNTLIIDMSTGETVSTIPVHTDSMAFSPDNKMLAVGDYKTKLELWDITTAKVNMSLKSPSKAYGYPFFSPDGKLVASCNVRERNGADVWEVDTGKLVITLPDAVCNTGAAFSPDDTMLAMGMGEVSIFDLTKGAELFKLSAASKVTFSPDGKYIATASYFDKTVALWAVG